MSGWVRRAALNVTAVVFFGLAVVAGVQSGLEPEFARSAAIMWLVALPCFGVAAALMFAAIEVGR